MKGLITIILSLSLTMTLAQESNNSQPDRGDFSLGLVQRLVRIKGVAETIMAEIAPDTITHQLDSLKKRLKTLNQTITTSGEIANEKRTIKDVINKLTERADKILAVKRSYRVLKITVDEFISQLTIDIQYRKLVYMRFYRKIDRYYKEGDELKAAGRIGNYRQQLLLIDRSLAELSTARAALNPSLNTVALGTLVELGTLLKDGVTALTQNRAKKVEAIATMLDKVRLRSIDDDSSSSKEDSKKKAE